MPRFGTVLTEFGQFGSDSTQFVPLSTDFGPGSTNFGQPVINHTWLEFREICLCMQTFCPPNFKIAQHGPNSAKIGATSTNIGPNIGQLGPQLDNIWPEIDPPSTKCGPNSAGRGRHPGRRSDTLILELSLSCVAYAECGSRAKLGTFGSHHSVRTGSKLGAGGEIRAKSGRNRARFRRIRPQRWGLPARNHLVPQRQVVPAATIFAYIRAL